MSSKLANSLSTNNGNRSMKEPDSGGMSSGDSSHPILKSFYLTQFMVFWIAPLFEIANKRQLLDSDVWTLPPNDTVHYAFDKLWKTWESMRIEDSRKGNKTSLLWVIIRCYFREFLLSGLLQLLFMLFQLGQPFLIIEIVKYIASGNGGIGVGIGLALGLGCVSLCSSISLAVSFYFNRVLGMEVKAGIMTAVYKQSLNLTSESRLSYSVGQITNLVAIDAEKVFFAVQFPHFLWNGPVICIIAMCILILYVGVIPAMAGMVTVAVLIYFQSHLASMVGTLRRSLVQFTDERVKLINEILQGIRVIKLYAWEVPTESRIYKTRDQEMKLTSKYLDLNGFMRELLFALQPLVCLVVFVVAIYALNVDLTRIQVVRLLTFLNITRLPLNLLGVTLAAVKNGLVSTERIERFLQASTVRNSMRTGVNKCVSDPKVHMANASFSWSNNSDDTARVDHQPDAGNSDDSDAGNDFKHAAAASIDAASYDEGLDLDIRDIYNEDNVPEEVELVPMQPDPTGTDTASEALLSKSFKLTIESFNTRSSSELIAVIGSVGSGKSSFMAAILGEIPLRSTSSRGESDNEQSAVEVDGPISYCSQTPWIQNMSLRENVLFGLSLDSNPELKQRYQGVLYAAALETDLKVLPFGDETEIGERGINLSGGQKARVSLARAFLSACRSQIFLLDDPFSAVDGATGNWIFEHGIKKLLHDKIRIVALNSHLHLLKHFDRIVILDEGTIAAEGSYEYLVEFHSDLFTRTVGRSLNEASSSSDALNELDLVDDSVTPAAIRSQEEDLTELSSGVFSSELDDIKEGKEDSENNNKSGESAPSGDSGSGVNVLIQKEKAAKGEVSYTVYMHYLSASLQQSSHRSGFYQESEQINFKSWFRFLYGVIILVAMIILFVVAQVARVAVDYCMLKWATAGSSKDSSWGTAYFILFGVMCLTLLLRSAYLNYFAVLSSRTIHSSVLRTVLSASIPLFFDTHTVGEILNRFSKDCETMDVDVPEFMLQLLINWLQVAAVFALCIYASPWFLIIMLPLAVAFRRIFLYFSTLSRDLKRLYSISRSPIFAILSETLTGLETIRAYGDTDRFLNNYFGRMEYNHKFFYHLWMSLSWVTVRLEITSTFILLSISLLTVCIREQVSPVALALALSYGLQLTALFQRCVQLSIDVSTYMTSTERMLEYLEIPVEKSTVNKVDDDVVVSAPGEVGHELSNTSRSYELVPLSDTQLEQWPTTGSIEFRDVWMNYRSNPSILRGISFKVRFGERIGVCGRTGAGKSSLMIALFRIVEISRGSILIGEVDISRVPLQLLRSKLAIIPQDPVLLTGSIRFQLDPFDAYSDLEVWGALEKVNMKEAVRSLSNGLNEAVRENGENLSQGQRQLICIARALLRQAQVLVVDEGTSAVDPTTDELIQNVLRTEASTRGTTVLAIAHRLQTIIDFDRILVLGAGSVLEYDTPANLMNNPGSRFAQMLVESAH